jgi:hypothetical protein
VTLDFSSRYSIISAPDGGGSVVEVVAVVAVAAVAVAVAVVMVVAMVINKLKADTN